LISLLAVLVAMMSMFFHHDSECRHGVHMHVIWQDCHEGRGHKL